MRATAPLPLVKISSFFVRFFRFFFARILAFSAGKNKWRRKEAFGWIHPPSQTHTPLSFFLSPFSPPFSTFWNLPQRRFVFSWLRITLLILPKFWKSSLAIATGIATASDQFSRAASTGDAVSYSCRRDGVSESCFPIT